jgi:hypothetical protein
MCEPGFKPLLVLHTPLLLLSEPSTLASASLHTVLAMALAVAPTPQRSGHTSSMPDRIRLAFDVESEKERLAIVEQNEPQCTLLNRRNVT